MDKLKSEEQIKIDINIPDTVNILYSDSAYVTANPYGVTIDFTQNLGSPTKQKTVARIGMSKEHAEALMGVIQRKIVEIQAKTN